jgi:hypothetical protein
MSAAGAANQPTTVRSSAGSPVPSTACPSGPVGPCTHGALYEGRDPNGQAGTHVGRRSTAEHRNLTSRPQIGQNSSGSGGRVQQNIGRFHVTVQKAMLVHPTQGRRHPFRNGTDRHRIQFAKHVPQGLPETLHHQPKPELPAILRLANHVQALNEMRVAPNPFQGVEFRR